MVKLMSSNVTDFCNRLESASLIDEEVADDVLTTLGVGNLDKATKLIRTVQKLINKDTAVVNFAKLCGILLQYRTAETFARNMMAEAGIIIFYDKLCVHNTLIDALGLKEEDIKHLQKVHVYQCDIFMVTLFINYSLVG